MVSVEQKIFRACKCGHAHAAHNSEGCDGWHAVHSDGFPDEIWLPNSGGTMKVMREACNCRGYVGLIDDLGTVNYHHKRLLCRVFYRLERWARAKRETLEKRRS